MILKFCDCANNECLISEIYLLAHNCVVKFTVEKKNPCEITIFCRYLRCHISQYSKVHSGYSKAYTLLHILNIFNNILDSFSVLFIIVLIIGASIEVAVLEEGGWASDVNFSYRNVCRLIRCLRLNTVTFLCNNSGTFFLAMNISITYKFAANSWGAGFLWVVNVSVILFRYIVSSRLHIRGDLNKMLKSSLNCHSWIFFKEYFFKQNRASWFFRYRWFMFFNHHIRSFCFQYSLRAW